MDNDVQTYEMHLYNFKVNSISYFYPLYFSIYIEDEVIFVKEIIQEILR